MKKRSRVKTNSRIRGSKTLEQIEMKFCMMVGLLDLVTRAKLDGDWFGHFRVVGVEFQIYPLTLVVVLTTLALPCQSVIDLPNTVVGPKKSTQMHGVTWLTPWIRDAMFPGNMTLH